MAVRKKFEKPGEGSVSPRKESLVHECLYSKKERYKRTTSETVHSHKLPSEASAVDIAVNFMDEYADAFEELAK